MEIQYYLIHCSEHTEREKHIINLQKDLDQKFQIFDGIYTKNISLENQLDYIKKFNENICFENDFRFFLSGQIGCYLSHFTIIEKIMNEKNNNELKYDYTVIFEDDVTYYKNSRPIEKIEKTINDLNSINYDFDLIFLGNLNDNKGINIINNIYYLDEKNNCFGTHALLINNKNIEKIYNLNLKIKEEMDIHYFLAGIKNEINCAVLYPNIFVQAGYKSNIKEDAPKRKRKRNPAIKMVF
jgi:GR25 family glycosyltransferase involved in LPS biosynthesis